MRSLSMSNSPKKPSADGHLTWRRRGINLWAEVTMKTRLIYCLFVAAALVGADCSQSDNTSQQTPLPPAPPAAPQAAVSPAASGTQTPALPPGHPDISSMSGQSLPAGAASDAPNPQWTVPADWQQGNPSSMRRATFLVKGADGQSAEIAVSVFPGRRGRVDGEHQSLARSDRSGSGRAR